MKINKLALQAFYESHRDEYLRRRFSGDKTLWDESYKWDILPRLNKELAAYDSVNGDSIAEIAHIVRTIQILAIFLTGVILKA